MKVCPVWDIAFFKKRRFGMIELRVLDIWHRLTQRWCPCHKKPMTRTLQDMLHWSARLRRIWDNLTTSRYERHLLEEIERIKDDRAIWRQKCERLELAIMPLASVAGARYAQTVNPPKPPEAFEPSPTSWAAIQANWAKELEKAEEKPNGNGVSTKEV